jgi:hypothetical protein
MILNFKALSISAGFAMKTLLSGRPALILADFT